MDHLIDYVQWMADYPIALTGFREPDALVLCALSYFDFTPLFSQGRKEARLEDALELIRAGQIRVQITGRGDGYPEFLEACAVSTRFGRLRMSDYVDLIRQEPAVQFSAVCFHGEDDFSFLAFRGTDSSLAGWKEDFNIAFERTEAQELAACYAERVIEPDRRWRIGGHSKGGNLALYAACGLSQGDLDRVERVYLLDGPGLCPEVMDLKVMERVEAKTTRVIPRFCVVGKIFEANIPDTRIVRSFATGIFQHGIISWGIDHGKLAQADSCDPGSLWMNAGFSQWVGNLSREERIAFSEDLFAALSAGGAEDLRDIGDDGAAGLEAIIRRLAGMGEVTRRALRELPRYMMKAGPQIPLLSKRESGPEAEHDTET